MEEKNKKAKKKFIKNTVKGTGRGSKYPEEIRVAALAMMLSSNNISDVSRRLNAVAQKYKVPESTLRNWYNKAIKAEGEKESIFAQARRNAIDEVAQEAARGALAAMQMMTRRAQYSHDVSVKKEDLINELHSLGAPVKGEEIETTKRREHVLFLISTFGELSDSSVANFARTFYKIGAYGLEERKSSGDDEGYEAFIASCLGDEF